MSGTAPASAAPDSPLRDAERALLLSVLDLRGPLRAVDAPELRWDAVMRVARQCKVLPLLADRALAEPTILSDPQLHARLREALHETAVYNTRLLAELARAAEVLGAAGVAHLALKGAALILRHYPRRAMRHAVDLDLLIDPQRFDRGLAALREAGYADASPTAVLGPDGRAAAPAPQAASHAAPLRGPSGVQVDLHHRVPTSGFDASGGFAAWHRRAVVCELQGGALRVAGDHDLAVHLCEHFVLQNYGDPVDAPRLLADLRALYAQSPPWTQLLEGSGRQRAAVMVARALHEAAFDADDGSAVTGVLQRVAVGDPSVRRGLAQLSNLRGHTRRIYLDLRHRPGYALRTWVPTRQYLGQRYGIDPRSPRIYPLYLTRLLRAAAKPLWPRR